jgi:hypothetical protein
MLVATCILYTRVYLVPVFIVIVIVLHSNSMLVGGGGKVGAHTRDTKTDRETS